MHWNATKNKRMTTKPDLTWFNDAMAKNKNTRSLQAIEIYQQRNKENIEHRMKAEIEASGVKTSKERMSIHHRIAAEMWGDEYNDTVAEIKVEMEKRKIKEKHVEKEIVEGQTPEDYNKLVNRRSYS